MGRHAKQRVSGGGAPTSVSATYVRMTTATKIAALTIDVIYSGSVPANSINQGTFETTPGSINQTTIEQLTPNKLRVTFSEDITDATNLNWSGFVAGVTSPDATPVGP